MKFFIRKIKIITLPAFGRVALNFREKFKGLMEEILAKY